MSTRETAPWDWPIPAPPLQAPVRRIGARTVDLRSQVLVMAVVNRTPDSFYDRGRTFGLEQAVAAGLRAHDDGADWVDVGGVPFRAGDPLPAEQEADRVVPVIERLRHERPELILSADTFHASVARACLDAGADVINDTTGLSDPELIRVVHEHGAQVVITHSLAGNRPDVPGDAPRAAVHRPRYDDVVRAVSGFLRERADRALSAGCAPEQIIVDPGHDLNKTTLHSLELTGRLPEIAALGHPVLAAVSNKDFVGESLGLPRGERLEGSLAAAVACVLGGARIVRMHEPRAARRAVDMAAAILGLRPPAQAVHNTGDHRA